MTHDYARWSLLRWVLLIFAILAPMSAGAATGYLDYLFRSPPLAGTGLAADFTLVLNNINRGEYLKADELMDTLRVKPAVNKIGPAARAQLLADAGILKAVTNQDADAIKLLKQSVKTVVESIHTFSPLQFNPLMAEGMVQIRARKYQSAVESFRRAQHVLHLQDGVYTRKQIPVLDQLTRIDKARGTLLLADIEQRFDLRIAERAYGANSEALIPTLEKVGKYFAGRGVGVPMLILDPDAAAQWLHDKVPDQYLGGLGGSDNSNSFNASYNTYDASANGSFPSDIRYYRASLFDEAEEMYQRAITILENKYGTDDLRLVQPLTGLSKTRLLEGGHDRQAEKAMERATNIVVNSPSTDLEDHVNALVKLGDLYTITGDSRAQGRYIAAWQMLSQHPAMKQLQDQLFAKPKRLYPPPTQFILDKQPIEAKQGTDLYAILQFTVDTRGVPNRVRVTDGNIPPLDRSELSRYFMRAVRYRPRIVDGKLVNTAGVTWRQTYITLAPSQTKPKSVKKKKATPQVAKTAMDKS